MACRQRLSPVARSSGCVAALCFDSAGPGNGALESLCLIRLCRNFFVKYVFDGMAGN